MFSGLIRSWLKEQAGADLLALARAEGGCLPAERQADLYQQLARAADAEKQPGAAQALWVEGLNRRLEREWLAAAWRSAERAGRPAERQAFFERQRERSPRDVRWAVAVRELRLLANDLEGAIGMARSAIEVRPERESLWREAADLMVRAGRPADAAELLARWQEPRPLDEDVVGWRAGLYARAGDEAKAVELQKAALEAYARQYAKLENGEEELASRRAPMVLGVKFGIKADTMFEVFKNSSAGSWTLNNIWAPKVLKGDFTAVFDLDLAVKDTGLALASGKALKVPLILGAMVNQRYQMESAAGRGKMDPVSSILSLEELAGVQVRSEKKVDGVLR